MISFKIIMNHIGVCTTYTFHSSQQFPIICTVSQCDKKTILSNNYSFTFIIFSPYKYIFLKMLPWSVYSICRLRLFRYCWLGHVTKAPHSSLYWVNEQITWGTDITPKYVNNSVIRTYPGYESWILLLIVLLFQKIVYFKPLKK
jgi:hypothetical protein